MSPRSAAPADHRGPGERRHGALTSYIVVYALLIVLLCITVIAAFLEAGRLALATAMLIAVIKTILVVLYFMHIRVASALTRLFVVAGVFWLGILFVLTFSDYLTRGWLPMSRGWTDRIASPPRADAEHGPSAPLGEGKPSPDEDELNAH
jgi:cytochrome c oxidase subunit IV